MTNINNKVKQYYGNNWCKHPRKEGKKNTDIDKDFGCETVSKQKNKKKKNKRKVLSWWEMCPFCEEELENDPNPEVRSAMSWIFGRHDKKQKCKCGAKGNNECPCCKRITWKKGKIYKHPNSYYNCGFEGEKKQK